CAWMPLGAVAMSESTSWRVIRREPTIASTGPRGSGCPGCQTLAPEALDEAPGPFSGWGPPEQPPRTSAARTSVGTSESEGARDDVIRERPTLSPEHRRSGTDEPGTRTFRD